MHPSTIVPGVPPAYQPSRRGEPPWEIAFLYPAQGSWTEADYLALNGTNWMVELADGCLEVLPMPTVFHQLIVRFLYRSLDGFITANALGMVLFAPLPVRLWAGQFREPDIAYFRPGRLRDMHSYGNSQ